MNGPPITATTATDRLLVIDSEPTNVQMLARLMDNLGFEVIPALNAAEALRLLAANPPDLILLEPLLPGMDGFELCERIQENPIWAEIPIVFLSSADDKNLIVRALENGGVDYVTKPFHKPELISRVRTQLMLKTAREHAKRLAQDKDELLSMISHHLQNHLAGIQMTSQLLLEQVRRSGDSDSRGMLENIRNSSGQMRAFVRAFLANAAADGDLCLRLETVNLTEVAQRTVRRYTDVANAKQINLHLNESDAAALARADCAALEQILENLISNAIKYSPPKSAVTLAVAQAGEQAECQVRDQGPGFTAQDKARMFGRYARLSARPTGGEPSTGLGLSIAKKLTEALHGELICESAPGAGATFILRLPSPVEVP